MEIRIEPRKTTDRGGYAMMPMRKNISEVLADWELTTCPECGSECWKTPLMAVVMKQGAILLCTECALKKGMMG